MKADPLKLRLLLSPEICRIETFDEIDSTNTYLKKIGREGAAHGTLVISSRQTAGRGRTGHRFSSPDGGLYMSLLLRPQEIDYHPGLYTVAAAVSVCNAVEKMTKKKCEIKWVNDVMLDGKKICGILTEGVYPEGQEKPDFIVVGIGINMNTARFPDEIKDIAGSMFLSTGRMYDPNILSVRVANTFMSYTKDIGARSFLSVYRSKLNCIGKTVFPVGHPEIQYQALDVDQNGELIVLSPDGTKQTLYSGEISVRLS